MKLIEHNPSKSHIKPIKVSQNLREYVQLQGKDAAFKSWLLKLKHTDTLPRGKAFKGKTAGRPCVIQDEFWLICTPTSPRQTR
ncbi:hypothetical protein LMH73_027165 [Vibrio splendidus]|nr:hypothetical protein [Vibrio splendidus]MCC4880487.1 hypothetical protein [Vibrio splendidus]